MGACPPTPYDFALGGNFNQTVHQQTVYGIPDGATTVNYTTTFESDAHCSLGGVFMEQLDASGHVVGSGRTLASDTTTLPFTTLSDSIVAGAVSVAVGGVFVFAGGISPGSIHFQGTINWFGTCDNAVLCTYGTQTKSGVLTTITVDSGLVELIASAFAIPAATGLLAITIGQVIGVEALCSQLPPDIPASFADAVNGNYPLLPSLADTLQYLEYLAWSTWCECKPATGILPPPVSPPLPVPVNPVTPVPPGSGPAGPPPVLVCDNTDICSTLNHLLALSGTINASINNLANTINNLKNTNPTTGDYKNGATYSDLSGTGILDVSGILGVSVSCTTIPAHLGRNEDNDPEYYGLGSIQLWGGFGWMARRKVTHAIWMWLGAPTLTQQVEYSFEPGVVADLTLIVPGHIT